MILHLTRSFLIGMALCLLFSCEEVERKTLIYSTHSAFSDTEVTIESHILDLSSHGAPVSYGICWADSPSPDISDKQLTIEETLSEKTFSLNMNGLERDKQYHARAFAIDGSGNITYGNEVIFINNLMPGFDNTRVSGYLNESVTVKSVLKFQGKSPITEMGHVWSLEPFPTIDDSNDFHEPYQGTLGQSEFETVLPQLSISVDYYVRPYAISDGLVIYGKQIVAAIPDVIITGRWRFIDLPALRYYHSLPMSINNNLYFFGTLDPFAEDVGGNENYYKIPHEFVGSRDQAGLLLQGQTPDGEITEGFAIGNAAYLWMRGNIFYEFETTQNQWTQKTGVPEGNVKFLVSDGEFGYAATQDDLSSVNFYKYTPSSDEWTFLRTLDVPGEVRKGFAFGPTIYFQVGENGFHSYDAAYDEVKTWAPFPKTPHVLFENSSWIYMISGNEVYAHDYHVDEWVPRTRAPIEKIVYDDAADLNIRATYLSLNGTYIFVQYPVLPFGQQWEYNQVLLGFSDE
jgi:hypothetical protein